MEITLRRPTLTEVNGIPCLTLPRDGLLHGGITFRVGRGDDPTHLMGISHLVEHLTLTDLGKVEYEFEGSVSHNVTTFSCRGTADEVADFLNKVAQLLANLPYHRLDHERRVLAREMAQQEGSAMDLLTAHLYGTQTIAATGLPDFGSQNITPEDIEDFRTTYFTKQNAVLWFSGNPPANLDIHLPEGNRIPPTVPNPLVELPAYILEEDAINGVAVAFHLERKFESVIAAQILEDRLTDAMRHELGISYDVSSDYIPLDSTKALAYFTADVDPKNYKQSLATFIDTIVEFNKTGPTQTEINTQQRQMNRNNADPDTIVSQLMAESEYFLLSGKLLADEMSTELTTEQIKVANEKTNKNTLFLCAEPPGKKHKLLEVSDSSNFAFCGTRYRRRLTSFFGPDIIINNKHGISCVLKDGTCYSMFFKDVVVVQESIDDGLQLTSKDGMNLTFYAKNIRNGAKAEALIREVLPPHIFVPAVNEYDEDDEFIKSLFEIEETALDRFVMGDPAKRLPTWMRVAIPGIWIAFILAMVATVPETEYEPYPFLVDALWWVVIALMVFTIILGIAGRRISLKTSIATAVLGTTVSLMDIRYDPDAWTQEVIGMVTAGLLTNLIKSRVTNSIDTPTDLDTEETQL